MNGVQADTMESRSGEEVFGRLRLALEQMAAQAESAGDAEQGGKLRELADKLRRGRLTAAFCGHFSAGKSTLVNALCGAALLPSSPVPTSANVVTVAGGPPSARMTLRDAEGRVTRTAEIAPEDLHAYAVDGEGVAAIEVTYPVPLLGDAMAIVDTPGVDSTDSAHRAATESALHLADVVFYVTDYNHVLSDVNFRFLRSLADWGKPTYVIVNMIDKHRETEVAFETFASGIRDALAAWGIHPAGLLFLSVKHREHPLSQWAALTDILTALQPLREPLVVRSARRSAAYLADRFRETLAEQHRSERERHLALLGDAEEGALERLASRRRELEERLLDVRGAGDRRQRAFRDELDRLLANANLTPAETREKARSVLESLQPGFKVGWFGGAAKTEAEREARLALLTDDFNRQADANLRSHLRDLLRKSAGAGTADAELEARLEGAFAPAAGEWLRSRVKPGAGADGQATLHYAAELSADLKADYRKEAQALFEAAVSRRSADEGEEAQRLEDELAALAQRQQAADALAALEAGEIAERDRLLSLLPAPEAGDAALQLPAPPSVEPLILPAAEAAAPTAVAASDASLSDAPATAFAEEAPPLGVPPEAAASLERAAEILSGIPALAKTVAGLRARAARFRERQFTIALFGAFSAGKSSFANALVGKPALPVSPNPTTAAINRIVAPTADQPEGTAWVTMKTREDMTGDIRHSLRRLGVPKPEIERAGDDPAALLALAGSLKPADIHPRGKPHLAFLRAAEAGWTRYADRLGTRLAASGDAYRRFAADETASCFVAEIDLAVDAPLTRGGAVLVDTPGADSINARHTGVSFEYIKNADAVFFVTYYNHAFTEADRQFLHQLGSVKDVFELDKMFFAINAADLAASDAELAAVKAHVASQLAKHGIRQPRLYAVSSLLGLQAKTSGSGEQLESSGLGGFERAFRDFASRELGELALASVRKELERAGKQLDGWLHAATAGAAEREAESRKWLALAERWQRQAEGAAPEAVVQPLLQEASDQLFHLRKRVYYRFGEHFQSAFHPSVLQDDGRDLRRMLASCWDDLQRGLAEDFLQELRAAGLRLEAALVRTLGERLQHAAADLADEGFAAETIEAPKLALPMSEPFGETPRVEQKRLWPLFKSPKHFFELEGAKALRGLAEEALFQAADAWLAELLPRWKAEIDTCFRDALRQRYAELAAELAAYARSLAQEASRPDEGKRLEALRDQWRGLADSLDSHS